MKKAVILLQGKQHIVTEGQELLVDNLNNKQKSFTTEALLLIDEKSTKIGTPTLKDHRVTLEIIEPEIKGKKVIAIRYKSKKRVRKIRGHRQQLTSLVVKKIN